MALVFEWLGCRTSGPVRASTDNLPTVPLGVFEGKPVVPGAEDHTAVVRPNAKLQTCAEVRLKRAVKASTTSGVGAAGDEGPWR